MISKVRQMINTPLMVGGGIRSATIAQEKLDAGADLIVIGTALEKNEDFLDQIAPIFT
jgi:heptaprenylglyceryl phosphate synthase